MAKCPKCGKEIDHLINVCETIEKYIFRVIDGNVDYLREDEWAGDVSEYYCPACESLLFDNEEDAEKFLTNSTF